MLVLQTYTQEHCSTYATDPGVICHALNGQLII